MKKVWLTLLVVLLSLCLASCGTDGNTPNKGDPDGGNQETPTEEPKNDDDIQMPPIDF